MSVETLAKIGRWERAAGGAPALPVQPASVPDLEAAQQRRWRRPDSHGSLHGAFQGVLHLVVISNGLEMSNDVGVMGAEDSTQERPAGAQHGLHFHPC